jgi:hypothetical protein
VSTLFLHGQEPWASDSEEADYPEFPLDAYPQLGGSFGAWMWYVTMATRIDPGDALRAADSIGSDRYVVYSQGAQTCGMFEIVPESPGTRAFLERAISDWTTTLPHGAELDIADKITLTVCDPGPGAAMNFVRPPQEIVAGPIARTEAITDVLEPQRGWWVEDELKERERWCLVETVQRAITTDEALEGLSQERIELLGKEAVRACLPDRAPTRGGGGPGTECSSAGAEPEMTQEGLPAEVQATRTAILEALVACDYSALDDLFAENGPYFGDASAPAPRTGFDLVDRWKRQEGRGNAVLRDVVTTLSSGWFCGPDLSEVVPDATGDACAWVSPGRAAINSEAWVVVIGQKGGWRGFGDQPAIQEELMAVWSATVTGERDPAAFDSGGPGASIGGLPPGWPAAIAPASLLEND